MPEEEPLALHVAVGQTPVGYVLLTARVFRNSFEISKLRSHSYSYNFGLSWPFSKRISKLVN